jgi:hypothetical protein
MSEAYLQVLDQETAIVRLPLDEVPAAQARRGPLPGDTFTFRIEGVGAIAWVVDRVTQRRGEYVVFCHRTRATQ